MPCKDVADWFPVTEGLFPSFSLLPEATDTDVVVRRRDETDQTGDRQTETKTETARCQREREEERETKKDKC